MKPWTNGRSIEIELDGGQERIEAQLLSRGLQGKHVESLASAALRYAEEETERLSRQLVPQQNWAGMVVCRKHPLSGGTAWLMLKYGKQGWRLDSALFD